jgi:hypothetical protein
MAPAGSDPRTGFSGQEPPPLPPPPPFEVATILDGSVQPTDPTAETGRDGRRHPREQAPPCRPITVRLASAECFSADILDISLGGLCLLIPQNEDLRVGQPLTLDFSAHRLPESMRSRGVVQALLRWYVRSGPVTTMGVGFAVPLPELPELL